MTKSQLRGLTILGTVEIRNNWNNVIDVHQLSNFKVYSVTGSDWIPETGVNSFQVGSKRPKAL